MGDPTGLLGGAVGELLHRVIAAAEKAVQWPEYCAQLQQFLHSIGPLVAQITSQEAQDGAHANSATRLWLLDLQNCLKEAAEVLETCGDQKHRWDPFARSRCGSKLLETTQRIKDFLQSQAMVPILGLLLQQMGATDAAATDLRHQVAQLSLGCEAQKLLLTEMIEKDRAFYVLKNGVEGLSDVVHLGSSLPSSSSSTSTKDIFDSGALEEQPIPQFVFGMDTLNQQIEDVLLGAKKTQYFDDGPGDEGNVTLNPHSKWVGVWAKGGSGKTLLVQNAMNNPIVASHFNSRVYSVVLGRSPDVLHLQRKLCSKIDARKHLQWNCESPLEGKTRLYNLLRDQRCLLILDDVWEEGLLDWFDVVSAEAGARILITSRNRPVLQRVQATELRVPELSDANSLKLFCTHAFGKVDGIPDHLEDVVKHVVGECKRLPLSLKVVGGFLAGKMERPSWEMALRNLREAEVLSNEYEEQLFRRLKLSYDDLGIFDQGGKLYKECFLYFAAFPEDEVIAAEHLVQLWAGDGLIGQQANMDPEIEGFCVLSVLIGRSLIELEKGYSMELSMPTMSCKIHDVLRDMGLYILRKGSQPWEQGCLFSAGNMNVQFPRDWLSQNGGDGACNIMQAQKLSLKSSKVTSLPSKMMQGRRGAARAAAPLRVMLLGECRGLAQLDGDFLLHFINLRVLDLSWATTLRSLPRTLGKLTKLVVLNLQSSGVQSLPQEIGKLCRLEYLNLQSCSKLVSLPGRGLSKLVSLKYLNARGCSAVWSNNISSAGGHEELQAAGGLSWMPCTQTCTCSYMSCFRPDQLCRLEDLSLLENLKKLWLGCTDVELLPDKVMGELTELRSVSMILPKLKELPDEMRKLSKVETLDLNACQALTELPDWVPESMSILKILDLRECRALCKLPSALSRLEILVKLELSGCCSLLHIPDEFGFSHSFQSLQELWLFACTRLKTFPELQRGAFPKLLLLNLFDCAALESLPESLCYIGPKLRVLNLGGCRQLAMPGEDILAAFLKLEELNLKGMPIKTLPTALVSLPSLKLLNISDCSGLQSLPEHAVDNEKGRANPGSTLYFPNLQELIVKNSIRLTTIPTGILQLPKLKRLDVTGCDNLELSSPQAVASRKDLQIKGLNFN